MDLLDWRKRDQQIDQLQQEIVALKSQLEKLCSLKNQLFQTQKLEAIAHHAGGIAHDFNIILQSILNYTQLALMDKTTEDPDYNIFKNIETNVKKGCRLTEQFLTLGRKINSQRKPCNLNTVIEEMEDFLHRTFPKTITIELDLEDNLNKIYADDGQCEQILMNLCINARDAMLESGRLILKTENFVVEDDVSDGDSKLPPSEYVRLMVKDTGRGIPAAIQAQIFEPFITTKAEGKGTGLGLSMVHALVKNHGGYIDFASEIGKGSTFWVYFPIFGHAV
jgi:signal transduction histidine kinase